MLKRDWTSTTSDFTNYNTLNSGHNWEDVIFHSRNQETCTASNHDEIRGRSDFRSELLLMLRRSYAHATQVALCKSKRQKLNEPNAPTYLRRREEVAAAGRRDPPPTDNERQQAAAGLGRARAMEGDKEEKKEEEEASPRSQCPEPGEWSL